MKFEHIKAFGFKAAVRGMRNPMESWSKSLSHFELSTDNVVHLHEDDLKLCKQLIKAGASHRKFLRFIDVTCDIEAASPFWREWDTYKFTVRNSCSQMHKMGSRYLTQSDFDSDTPANSIDILNDRIRDWKDSGAQPSTTEWRRMLMAVPQGFIYRSTIHMNYEVFITQYFNRHSHKLTEWIMYCSELRKTLPYMDDFLKVLEG